MPTDVIRDTLIARVEVVSWPAVVGVLACMVLVRIG